MRHLKSGKKLNRTASHRKATLQSLASNLFEHKRIKTTTAKAKALRPYAEKLITKAKNAIANEQNGSLPEGQTIDIHSRRIVARELKRKEVLQELFDSIAPVVAEREGGFTRIIKLGTRRGDSAEVALIELVDWSNPQESANKPKKAKKSTPKVAPATEEVVKEEVAEVKAEETAETAEAVAEETKAEATEEVAEEVAEVKAEEATETAEEVAEETKAEEAVEATEETTEAEGEAESNEEDSDAKDEKKD